MEVLWVRLLLSVEQMHSYNACNRILDLVSHDLNVLEQHHGLKCAMLHGLDRVLDTKADQLCVHRDLLEELSNDLLLVHELDVGQ